jgi:hypothetical protein
VAPEEFEQLASEEGFGPLGSELSPTL